MPTAGIAGPGGYAGGNGGNNGGACPAVGTSGSGPGGSISTDSGGGGGSHGGVGGMGCNASPCLTNGYSIGGVTYGALDNDIFGGSGGAGGNGCYGGIGGGGAGGGGSVQLWSKAMTIDAGGKITANGGNGGSTGGGYSGGGGGGAGGRIIISAINITNNGSLEVKGGIGGTGYPSFGKHGGGGGGGRIILRDSDGLIGGTGTTSVTGGSVTSPATSGGNGILTMSILSSIYQSSGTFESTVINLGGKITSSLASTLAWTNTLPINTTITMQIQTSADNGTWSGYSAITNGGSITIPAEGVQYVRYKVALNTTDIAVTPTLDSVTISYMQ